ncbi:MAG: hypothetical protein ACRDHG_07555 [Anaerolineales bacterium]
MLLDRTHSILANFPIPGLDPAILEAVHRPRLSLFWGTRAPTQTLLIMFTLLAAQGETPRLFDGGNRFDGYFVARLARRLTPQPRVVLSRMRLSRAFTCFQLAELIDNTPTDSSPLFVLDLLNTFYDESVPPRDVERLLARAIAQLKRLAAVGPVIVGAGEPQSLVKERWGLLDQLQAAADLTWMLRPPQEETLAQPRLF